MFIIGIGELRTPGVVQVYLLCKVCKKDQEAVYLRRCEAVHFPMLWTFQDRFVFEVDRRGYQRNESLLECKRKQTATATMAAAEGGDEDGGVENEAHFG